MPWFISLSISVIWRFISRTVGLLLSVSLAWPDESPSSNTGILEYKRKESLGRAKSPEEPKKQPTNTYVQH